MVICVGGSRKCSTTRRSPRASLAGAARAPCAPFCRRCVHAIPPLTVHVRERNEPAPDSWERSQPKRTRIAESTVDRARRVPHTLRALPTSEPAAVIARAEQKERRAMTVTNDIDEDIEVLDGVEMYRISPIDRIDPFLMTRREQLRPVDVRLEHRWADRRTRRARAVHLPVRDRRSPPSPQRPRRTRRRCCASARPGATILWEPFTGDQPDTRRSLLKSLLGNVVVFEEQHLELGLTIRYRWAPSDRFGWVRTVSLISEAGRRTGDGRDRRRPARRDAVGRRCAVPAADEQSRERLPAQRDHRVRTRHLHPRGVDRRSFPNPPKRLRATTVWSTGLGEPSAKPSTRAPWLQLVHGDPVRRVLTEDRPPRLVPGQRHRRDRPGRDPAMACRRRRGPEPRRHRSAHP